MPGFMKVFIAILVIVLVAWVSFIGYLAYSVVSDPKGAGETIGEAAGSIAKGFNDAVNKE